MNMPKVEPHEKPDIKIKDDFMESNLGYSFNGKDLTDDDIYYYWGYKNFFGFRQTPMANNNKKLSGIRKNMLNASREDLIGWARKNMRPILPDEREFIPRKYWPSFEELMGEDLRLLHHPIWWLTQKIIRENFIPSSDTLMIQACSNMKPYYDNRNYAFTKKRFEEGYFDLVVNSCELVPIEFTIYYPFRHYDWSHLRETELMQDSLIRNNFHSIVSFINTFKYKKVLLLGPTKEPDTFYRRLYELLKENYNNTDVEIILVLDDETNEKNLKAAGGASFCKARYQNLTPTKDKIDSIINYRGPLRDYIPGSSLGEKGIYDYKINSKKGCSIKDINKNTLI